MEINVDTKADIAKGKLETLEMIEYDTDIGDLKRNQAGKGRIMVDEEVQKLGEKFALVGGESAR